MDVVRLRLTFVYSLALTGFSPAMLVNITWKSGSVCTIASHKNVTKPFGLFYFVQGACKMVTHMYHTVECHLTTIGCWLNNASHSNWVSWCTRLWIAPSYLQEYVIYPPSSICSLRLRSADTGQLYVPRTRTILGESVYVVAGPRAWNSLPVMVRSAPSLSIF